MTPPKPSEDAIRKRAHAIWLRRGGRPGSAVDDWHQAERELAAEAPSPPSPVPAPRSSSPSPTPAAPSPPKSKKKKR